MITNKELYLTNFKKSESGENSISRFVTNKLIKQNIVPSKKYIPVIL